MISDAVKRLIAAAQAAVDEYAKESAHDGTCTCAGCMLDLEIKRVTAPCKTCSAPRWRHLSNHRFQE